MTSTFRAIVGGVCLLLLALAFSVGEVDAQTPATVRPLAHTRVVLPNGLVALFNEDRSAPMIGAVVWYGIGARDEGPGQLGYAHLCEHMLFEGSPNVPAGQFISIMRASGATSSRMAETSEDRTLYFQAIPNNQLETWLWLESDRMAVPFAAMDSSRLAPIRTVIKLERQQQRENIPFGFANTATLATLYGGDRPYRDPLTSNADIEKATLSGMRQFCEPYYVPNNAVVAISGDFETAKARALVEKYFGSIKPGPMPQRAQMRPTKLDGDRRFVLEDARANVPLLRLAWSGAGFAERDRPALVALAAVLQGDRRSGLVKALVYDQQLATSVNVNHFDVEQGGIFQIEVAPRGSASLGAIEDLIDSLVRIARDAPPDDRVFVRLKRANAVTAISSLQSRVIRADTLAQGEKWANDPVAYAGQVDRMNRLTGDDIHRVAMQYLTPGRVVMSMIPAGKLDLVSKPERGYEKISAVVPEVTTR